LLSSIKIQKQEENHGPQQLTGTLLLDRKIDEATAGLDPAYSRRLYDGTLQNTVSIVDYILSMKTEINLSDHYRKDLINLLTAFSKYSNTSFKSITRET
jgi:hypothetical protein